MILPLGFRGGGEIEGNLSLYFERWGNLIRLWWKLNCARHHLPLPLIFSFTISLQVNLSAGRVIFPLYLSQLISSYCGAWCSRLNATQTVCMASFCFCSEYYKKNGMHAGIETNKVSLPRGRGDDGIQFRNCRVGFLGGFWWHSHLLLSEAADGLTFPFLRLAQWRRDTVATTSARVCVGMRAGVFHRSLRCWRHRSIVWVNKTH